MIESPVVRLLVSVALLALAGCASGRLGGEPELLTLSQLRARGAGPIPPRSGAPPRPERSGTEGATGLAPRDGARFQGGRDPEVAPVSVHGRWIRVDGPQPVIPLRLYRQPLADVVSALSEQTGYNIVLSSDSAVRAAELTAEVGNLPWHRALEVVLEAHGLRPVQIGDRVVKITTEQRAEQDRDPEPLELRFLNARDVAPAIERIVRSGGDTTANGVVVYGDPESSQRLIVYTSSEKMSQVRSLLAKMDRRPPTVTVEARVVSVNRTAMRKIGISYAFGQIRDDSTRQLIPGMDVRPVGIGGGISSIHGPALKLVRDLGGLGIVRLNVFVDALSGRGLAETQTAPVIATTSGVPARIRVGDAFILPNSPPILATAYPPYVGHSGESAGAGSAAGSMRPGTAPGGYGDGRGGLQPGSYPGAGALYGGGFTRFETGTSLHATPHVVGDGLVRMRIDLLRDGGNLAADGRSIVGGNQEAFTDVIVRSGTPIVIGGLTVSATSRTSGGVPLLRSLPLLGRLFRVDESAEQYQDLIIIVTPRIHEGEGEGTER